MHDSREPEAVVRAFFDAITRGDGSGFLEALDDDLEWWIPGTIPVSGTRGKDVLLDVFAHVATKLTGLTMTARTFTVEGNRVSVVADSHGEYQDGTPYQNFYHFLFEVHGGRIRRVREYNDTERMRPLLEDIPDPESLAS